MWRFSAAFALALVVGLDGRAGASEIVDQQNNGTGNPLSGNLNAGQSFRPTLDRIDFATFTLWSDRGAAGANGVTAVLDLREGDADGADGTLLGTSESTSFRNVDFRPIRFNFASPIFLTPGNVYTLVVRSTNNLTYAFPLDRTNSYNRGTWFNGPVKAPPFDMVFSEGASIASVPEPSTLAGAGLGVALAVGAALRRRKVASA